MKTIVNEELVVALVEEIQLGKAQLWDELYSELQKHKSFAVNKSSKKLTGVCSKPDVDALYDDCLMYAVDKFDAVTNDSFTAFLTLNFNTRGIDLFKKAQAEKRQANLDTADIADEEIKLESKVDMLVEDLTVSELMTEFSNQSDKQAEQMKLIIAAMNSDESDRVEALLSILPDGTTAKNASVKLFRAKKEFKEFLEKVKFL